MQKIEWNNEFVRELQSGNYPKYPNEVMLKIIFGSYLENSVKPQGGWRVLDVGCAFGSNLIPFADMGCAIHGIDIHCDIANSAKKMMDARGYSEGVFSEGTNRSIPYEDNYFDLLLSINTLHYEASEQDILGALAEFKRVLKPDGVLYLSTVGPDHEIYLRSKLVDHHINEIQNFGFRDGEKFFFFDNERYLKYYLAKYFKDIETGKVQEKLMKLPLDFLIGVARKDLG
jgi:ubiquinone/menaquinone biosynthesis C-methylase UbiE